jgi:predicted lipid carrier protein YhbT
MIKLLPLPSLAALPAIPEFRLPEGLAKFGHRLPQWPHGALLSLLLNAAIRMGILPEDSLAEMEGKRFRITVRDLGSVANFRYVGGRFNPISAGSECPHLSFTADASAYLQLVSRQEDPDTLFFNRRLDIEGDTELGLRVKNMLDALDLGQ